MNIKIIKLVTGDEIICEISPTSNHEQTIIIHPIQIGMTENGLGMAPWFVTSSEHSFLINNQHILTQGEPATEIRDKFSEITGGIVMPEKRILTPVH